MSVPGSCPLSVELSRERPGKNIVSGGHYIKFLAQIKFGMIKTLLIRNSLNNLLPQFDDKPNNLTNGIEYIPKPIGLLYIKTFFEQEGLVCDILDLDVIKPSDRLKICLDTAYNYDYIGFSTMTCAFNDTCRIASEIKKNQYSHNYRLCPGIF